mgnify:CR=1 FL=1
MDEYKCALLEEIRIEARNILSGENKEESAKRILLLVDKIEEKSPELSGLNTTSCNHNHAFC